VTNPDFPRHRAASPEESLSDSDEEPTHRLPFAPALGGMTAYTGPDSPARVERRPRWTALVLSVWATVVAASGLGLGWLWAELAPRVTVIKVDGGFVYADPEPEQAVAADGWFALLGAAAGVVLALLAWVVLRRYRGPAVLLALTVGSLVSAGLALWLGHRIGQAQFAAVRDSAAIGSRLQAPWGCA
jgi:hypothetical protein